MPRQFPTLEDIDLPNVQGPRPVASYDVSAWGQGAQAIAKGVQTLGGDIQKSAQDVAEVRTYQARNSALLAQDKILGDAIGLREKYKHDQDFSTLPDRYNTDLDNVVQQGLQGVPEGPLRDHVTARLQIPLAHERASVNEQVFNGQRQNAHADLYNRANAIVDTTGPYEDPTLTERRLSFDQIAQEYASKGLITPLEAQEHTRNLVLRRADAEARARMNLGPEEAAQVERELRSASTGQNLFPPTRGADTSAFLKARTGARVEGLNPIFADRLTQAAQDYERQTGGTAQFESLKRTTAEQAEIYQRHLEMPGGVAAHPAAPPGSSRHEIGEAGDIPDGPFQQWLHHNADKYGLAFPVRNDPGHIQLAANNVAPLQQSEQAGPQNAFGNPIFSKLTPQHRDGLISLAVQAQKRDVAQSDRKLQSDIGDDLAAAERTGYAGRLKPEDFSIYGDGAQAAYNDYQTRVQLAGDRFTMRNLSSDEQQKLLAAHAPVPGTPGYAEQAKMYDGLQKTVAAIAAERTNDPAKAVANDDGVKTAQAAHDPNDPHSFAAVADARMAAQQALGIAEEDRAPLTKAEALQLTVPLRRMFPGQEAETVKALAAQFQDHFGRYADQAFAYALHVNKINADTATVAARFMKKLATGEPIMPAEARQMDQQGEVQAADAAVNPTLWERFTSRGRGGEPFGPRSATSGRAAFGPGVTPIQGVSARGAPPSATLPPVDDITALRHNPALAEDFDRLYGKGSAKKVIEGYPVLTAAEAAAPAVAGPDMSGLTQAEIVALRNNPSSASSFDQKYGAGAAKKVLEAYPGALPSQRKRR